MIKKTFYGKMKHPSNAYSGLLVNKKWPHFSSKPRNLRHGIVDDGINSYASLSFRYSS